MNQASSILRAICGIVIIALSVIQYRSMKANLVEGGHPQLFGHEVGISGTQLTVVFVVLGLIGLYLLAFGLMGLKKR